MKKLLLSCFIALGIGANAQYNYTGTFDDSPDLYGQFGQGTITAAAACTGALGGQIASPNTANYQSGYMLMLDELEIFDNTQTNNGQAATVTMNYKKAAGPVGTIYPMLFSYDENTDLWNITDIGAPASLTSAAITTCGTLTGSIAAGVMIPGKVYAVGFWYVRSSGSGNVFVDNIKIEQNVVATAPDCTTITSPAHTSTVNYGDVAITWGAAPTAVGYHLTVGTSSGASDVFSGNIMGGLTEQYVSTDANSTYYVNIVPFNNSGDAVGCTETSFNTNNTISYCGVSSTNVDEKFSRFRLADIDHSNSSSAAYVDFTSVTGHVVQGQGYLATANLSPSYTGNITAVWIDYNHDGIFSNDERTILTGTATATGTITIPCSALLGDTRMRIRVDYQVTPIPCGIQASGYGQAWDFTINIAEPELPSCVAITSPADGATDTTVPTTTLTWTADANASGYKVYVGTTSGGTDIVNGTLATGTTFDITGLSKTTQYFAKVVPTNCKGDATGCTEISFTTGSTLTYCAATHTTTGGTSDRITNVSFSNISNASTNTNGYLNATAVVGNVTQKGVYAIALTIANGNTNDKAKVWIDYNQNGQFEDGEMTLLTRQSNTLINGNITIPQDAVEGNTRMRIRMSRQSNANNIVACGNISAQGETEDYTLDIAEWLGVSSNVSKGNISVYPNPFTDVLRISDVKDVKSVSVSDMSGRTVKTLAPAAELNLSSLKTGVYVVTLNMNDGSVKTFKAIKK